MIRLGGRAIRLLAAGGQQQQQQLAALVLQMLLLLPMLLHCQPMQQLLATAQGRPGAWSAGCGTPAANEPLPGADLFAKVAREEPISGAALARLVSQLGASGSVPDQRRVLRNLRRYREQLLQQRQQQQPQPPTLPNQPLQPVYIRLNVVCDGSLEEQLDHNATAIVKFVRQLVYATQLILEQPELSSRLQLVLVVGRLAGSKQSFPSPMNGDYMLNSFTDGPDALGPQLAELNVLLTFRTLWLRDWRATKSRDWREQRKVIGIAHVGTICNPQRARDRALLLSAGSVGNAYVFAHELAHSLGCQHDDMQRGAQGQLCAPEAHIMSATVGPGKLSWSACSVDAILQYVSRPDVSRCLGQPTKLIQPAMAELDLRPAADNPNRLPLPGGSPETDLDAQCSQALAWWRPSGAAAVKSGLSVYERNGDDSFETCQSLICAPGALVELSVGPAAPGSSCKVRGSKQRGVCFNGACCKPGASGCPA